MFLQLDTKEVVETMERLSRSIEERFPGAR